LEKADPEAEVSTPKEPIIFGSIRQFHLSIASRFATAFWSGTRLLRKPASTTRIEVRQQPDDATWDPGDIRYNTFQWITASAGFAQGRRA